MDVINFFKNLFTIVQSALTFIFSDVVSIYPFKVVVSAFFGVGLFSLVYRFFKGV